MECICKGTFRLSFVGRYFLFWSVPLLKVPVLMTMVGFLACVFFFSSIRAAIHGGGGTNIIQVFNLIKDVQKKFKTRELEKKELEVRK